jgi:hypothetical protein
MARFSTGKAVEKPKPAGKIPQIRLLAKLVIGLGIGANSRCAGHLCAMRPQSAL